jgi:hypothetical protein
VTVGDLFILPHGGTQRSASRAVAEPQRSVFCQKKPYRPVDSPMPPWGGA